MNDGGGSISANGASAGGPIAHVPVMLDEVLSALKPGSGNLVVDATFGAGGYSRAILDTGARVLAIDRDPVAIAAAGKLASGSGGMFKVAQGRFSELDEIARQNGFHEVDGIVLDIGVSSMQLDDSERGFSFSKDGPLDMRMERSGPTAAEIVNRARRKDLTRIIGLLGEERAAARVSRAIEARRLQKPFSRTLDLAGIVASAVGRRPGGGSRIHPATRTFMALRMFVNSELQELAKALFAAERLLRTGGRLVVVTFHSLEDRIVKRFFTERAGRVSGSRHRPPVPGPEPTFRQEVTGALVPSSIETDRNPRSRSARLRYAIRTGAPAQPGDMSLFGLPELVSLELAAQRGGT
jgi:16S rRNA (cytosine1402-N4)-methyltransferase